MLLTFDEDGTVQFTRNPSALAIVDGLGKLRVTRMSEILFDEDRQLFYIKILTGQFSGFILRWLEWWCSAEAPLLVLWNQFMRNHSAELCRECVIPPTPIVSTDSYVFMRTYEDAVRVEVAFIDFLREMGIRVQ